MKTFRAGTKTRIFGTRNSWSLSWHPGFPKRGTECNVRLEIEGDEKGGYNLVQSPEGFFAADTWHSSVSEAKESAKEMFGVGLDQWIESNFG